MWDTPRGGCQKNTGSMTTVIQGVIFVDRCGECGSSFLEKKENVTPRPPLLNSYFWVKQEKENKNAAVVIFPVGCDSG